MEDVEAKDRLIEGGLETTGRLLSGMRRLAGRLRSSLLDDLGLEAALRSCIEEFEGRSGVPVDFRYEVLENGLNEHVSESAYRIVQESLTNVSRHAGASEVGVRVRTEGARLSVLVRDTGVGFDLAGIDTSRFGHIGMRERAELLGGSLDVQSSPGQGTVVSASLPLVPQE
jgi:signal transduction histidine kinase